MGTKGVFQGPEDARASRTVLCGEEKNNMRGLELTQEDQRECYVGA